MKKYIQVNVKEGRLEDLVIKAPEQIEEGLKFLDHQRHTDRGRLDVLLVDSEGALVVGELKVVEDDNMLFQGLDYYDYVSSNLEALARLYKDAGVDVNQPIRLFLVAPSFSVNLINRCKWIDIEEMSLFTYKCIKFEDSDEIIPVYTEIFVPSQAKRPEEEPSEEKNLAYITDDGMQSLAKGFLKEVNGWKPGAITIEPIKYSISLKVNGRVFAYISPRRRAFVLETHNDGVWTGYPVRSAEDLDKAMEIAKANMNDKSG